MKKKNIIFAIILLSFISFSFIYFYNNYKIQNGTFSGTVSSVENCSVAIGTSRCTWVIDSKKVSWSWGSALESQNTGDVDSMSLSEEDIGKKVEVNAKPAGPNEYTINQPEYYIKER